MAGSTAPIAAKLTLWTGLSRPINTPTMEDPCAKLIQCARAAALASGATLEVRAARTSLRSPVLVPEYQALVRKSLAAVGVQADRLKKGDPLGSSDLGNVGHAYPTVNLMFPVAPRGVPLHSDDMRRYSAPETAWSATVQAAKAVALTVQELLNDPEKVKAIQARFQELQATE